MKKRTDIFQVEMSELDFFIINKVKELRIQKKISQVELANRMELSSGVIGKIENFRERAKYSIRHLNLLANALGCSPCDFLPAHPLKNDLVKITISVQKENRTNKSVSAKEAYYKIEKIEPAEDKEL